MTTTPGIYPWTRFWTTRESSMHLGVGGYLLNPLEGDGKLLKEGLAKKKLKAKGQKRATTYTAA